MEIVHILKAIDFAAFKHRDQRRKDIHASPYLNHVIKVALFLSKTGSVRDVDVLTAAILHDTIEDTDTSLEELVGKFGGRVSSLVNEVSDDKNLPRAERKRLQIEHARHLSEGAVLIKLGDKIANVIDVTYSPPPGWNLTRRRGYLDWAEAVIKNCPPVNRKLEDKFYEVLNKGRSRLSVA